MDVLLTRFLRKKCFCIQCENRGGYWQLMSATKPIRTFKPLAISHACTCWFVFDLGGNPKDMLSSLGLNNDLFLHICVIEGADQLRGNRIISRRLTIGKSKKNLLLNHEVKSFNILCDALISGTQHKSFQSCPWGLNWPRPGGHHLQ